MLTVHVLCAASWPTRTCCPWKCSATRQRSAASFRLCRTSLGRGGGSRMWTLVSGAVFSSLSCVQTLCWAVWSCPVWVTATRDRSASSSTCMCTHASTCKHTHVRTHKHAHMHAHLHKNTHPPTSTPSHPHARIPTHWHMHKYTHTPTNPHKHTHAHMHAPVPSAQAHTHTHTHTHTPKQHDHFFFLNTLS